MKGGAAASNTSRNAALKLYRNILRAHQQYLTNHDMKMLGDRYVKSEFKLHKNVTNQTQLDQFFVGWNEYLNHITQTGRKHTVLSVNGEEHQEVDTTVTSSSSSSMKNPSSGFGQNLPLDIELSEEQMNQLEKLREETTKKG